MFAQKTTSSDELTIKLIQNLVRVQNNNRFLVTDHNYSYYEKTIVSAEPDSISAVVDTIYKNKKKNKFSIDSSSYKFKRLITKQHLYQLEKLADVSIKTNKNARRF